MGQLSSMVLAKSTIYEVYNLLNTQLKMNLHEHLFLTLKRKLTQVGYHRNGAVLYRYCTA